MSEDGPSAPTPDTGAVARTEGGWMHTICQRNNAMSDEGDNASPTTPHPTERTGADSGWMGVIIPSVMAAMIGGLAGWWAAQTGGEGGEMSGPGGVPSAVVMDSAAWLEAARNGDYDLDSDNIASRMESVATELRAQGVIVLYPEAVMASPSTRRVGPDVLE
mgnify:CR=1 FL=1